MTQHDMDKPLNVVFSGGGSGGHIFPSIAIAEALWDTQPDANISFLTSGRDIDRIILDQWLSPGPFLQSSLELRSSTRRLRYIYGVAKSVSKCIEWYRTTRPDVVVGTGGFASVPGMLAANWLRIPTIVFEPNRVPGRASRMLARSASATLTGLGLSAQYRSAWPGPLYDVGVPVRPLFQPAASMRQEKLLLVLGGSLGATSVNSLVVQALTHQACLPADWRVIHQTGHRDSEQVNNAYQEAGISADVRPFVHDIADALGRARVVISRAGAVTLAESATVGRGSIIIPMLSAKDGHQFANATYFAENGAAEIIDEQSANAAQRLADTVRAIAMNDNRQKQMQRAAASIAGSDAATRAATFLTEQFS